jgi:hypothetical protein
MSIPAELNGPEQGGVRPIEPAFQDFFAALYFRDPSFLNTEISEATIAAFCSSCDFVENRKVCSRNDQARYANRKWCGWSRKDDQKGKMTENGFIPFKKSEE